MPEFKVTGPYYKGCPPFGEVWNDYFLTDSKNSNSVNIKEYPDGYFYIGDSKFDSLGNAKTWAENYLTGLR